MTDFDTTRRSDVLRPTLTVSAPDLRVGDPLTWKVWDASPGERLDVKAETKMGETTWASRATFVAGADGCIDPALSVPVAGTYEGREPFGLLWSMRPLPAGSFRDMPGMSLDPVVTTFVVERAGAELARAQARREIFDESLLKRREVREHGLVGAMFSPTGGGRSPGVVVLGGSEGGLVESFAAALAGQGFAALALAYFGMEGVPPSLTDIPLEYFRTALDWLRRQPEVADVRPAVAGASKGGELALLLGSTYDDIGAVLSIVGSGVVFMGIGRSPFALRHSSWSKDGNAVPFVRARWSPRMILEFVKRGPLRLRVFYEEAMRNSQQVVAATIPTERIRGPVLCLSAPDDQMWPSSVLSDIACRRIAASPGAGPVEHVTLASCGHAISLPYMPAVTEVPGMFLGRPAALGGTPSGQAAAVVQSWERSVAFLKEHLG
jgi:dienelactone hydrolase